MVFNNSFTGYISIYNIISFYSCIMATHHAVDVHLDGVALRRLPDGLPHVPRSNARKHFTGQRKYSTGVRLSGVRLTGMWHHQILDCRTCRGQTRAGQVHAPAKRTRVKQFRWPNASPPQHRRLSAPAPPRQHCSRAVACCLQQQPRCLSGSRAAAWAACLRVRRHGNAASTLLQMRGRGRAREGDPQ